MFTERTMSDRLQRILDAASPSARAMGTWYRDVAARDCTAIAAETGVPFHVVAGLMAVLSPGPKYAQNVADTRAMARWYVAGGDMENMPTVTTYGPNRIKAAAILRDMDTRHVSGPKVTAFLANILGDSAPVTLDRHAVRPLSKSGKDMPTGKVERARMTAAYVKTARKNGYTPSAFQAIIWCAVRGAAE